MKQMNRLGIASFLIASLSISMARPLHAANETWNGSSGSWGVAGNWTPAAVPGSGDTVIFNSSGGTVTLPTAESIGSITFDTNARSYGITGSIVNYTSGAVTNPGSLTLTGGGTIQIASTLTGAGRQENIYAPLVLGGNYTFANNSGTNANTLAILGNVNLATNTLTLAGANTSNVDFTSTGDNIVSGIISGSGALVKNGTGNWYLSGANTFTGTTTVNSGVLKYSGASGTFATTSAITVASGASVALTQTVATSAASIKGITISGGGAGGVDDLDSFGETLGNFAAFEAFASNTYSGSVTLGADSSIASTNGSFTFTPGTGSTGSINTAGHQLALLTEATYSENGSMTIDDVISGSGGITRNAAGTFGGPGAVTLGAANTYTGSTVLDNGTLSLDFSQTTAPQNNIINTTATNTLVLHGGKLNLIGKASTNNSQSFSAGGTTIGSGASSLVIANNATANNVVLDLGAITHNVGGTVDFTEPTAGTVSATNGYMATGTSNDAGGIIGGYATVGGTDWATLSSGNIVALAPGSYTNDTWGTVGTTNVTVTTNSTQTNQTANTLQFNAAGSSSNNTVTLAGTDILTDGGILVTSNVGNHTSNIVGSGTLEGSSGGDLDIIDNNNSGTSALLTISATIANNGLATGLTKSGAGALSLTGTNSYTGITTLNAGTLNIGNASALGGSTSLVINGGTINNTTGGALSLTNSSMTEVWNADFTFTGSNSLNLGTGAISLGTTPGSQRGVTVSGSTLTIGGVISDGTSTPATTGLSKLGNGTLLLTGASTYDGPTGIVGGVLNVTNLANGGSASAIGESSNLASNLVFDGGSSFSGSVLEYTGTTAASTDRLFTIGEVSATLNASGTTTAAALDFTNTGVITLASPETSVSYNKYFTLTGTNTGNNIFTPILTDYNSAALLTVNKNGTGTWLLAGANTYTGETVITGGTLGLSNYNALQDSTLVNNTVTSPGQGLTFNAGTGGTYTLGGLIGTLNLNLVDAGNNAITLQIGNNNYTTSSTNNLASPNTYVGSVYSGVLSDGGLGSNIVKVGTGVWTPSGANTYTGTTTVSAGTLAAGAAVSPSVAGPFGNSSSAIILGDANTTANNSSATLLNNGFNIARAITVSNNATKGTYSIGGNTSGSTTYSGLITLNQNLTISQAATTGSSALNITGGITSGGGSETVNFAGPGAINVNTTAITNGSGTVGVNVTGGTTTFTKQDSYTGSTGIGGGNLLLDFSQAASPTSNIVSSSSALVLGGGTLSLNGKSGATDSQTFNGAAINPGASSVVESANGTNGSVSLALGTSALTRSVGGTVNFVGAVTSGTPNDARGIIGGYATVNGTDWAVNDGNNNIVALAPSSYYTTTTGGNTAANYANKNVDVTSSPTLSGAFSANTLRFNTAVAETLALNATGTTTLTDGGILVTSNVGAKLSTISSGTLTGSSGGDLIINQNNTAGGLTISSVIANNGSATGLTKSGAGTLTLTGVNTYTGNTYLNAGTVVIGNSAAFGGNSTSVPGTGGTVYMGNGVELAATGATEQIGNAVDINGNVTFGDAVNAVNNQTVGLLGVITLTSNAVVTVNNTTVWKNAIGDGGNGYGLTKNGTGTLDFGSASSAGYSTATYSGATTVNAGTLAVNMAATNYVNPINPASNLVLGGGAFNLSFSSTAGAILQSQTFNNVTLNAGASAINTANSSGTGESGALNLGQITRNVGATVDVTSQGGITTSTNYGTGVIGYMTVGGASFAAVGNTNTLTQASTNASYSGATSASSFSGNYIDIGAGASVTSGVITPSALRFNVASATLAVNSSTLPSENVIGSGGILVTSNATGSTAISVASGTGYLTSGNGQDLIVIDNATSSSSFSINPVITDNGSTSISLTKSGVGTLVLGGANTYTGATYLNGGTIQANTTTALGSATTANLIFGNSTTTSGAFNLNGFNTTVVGLSTTTAGIVGAATVEAGVGGNTNATFTVNNTANDTFNGTFADGANNNGSLSIIKSGSGTLVLTGGNSSYSGTTAVNAGALTLNGGGSLPQTVMTVSNSGTTVNIGGNYTIGNALGAISGGALTFNSGTVLNMVDGTFNALTLGNSSNPVSLTLNSATLDLEVGSSADAIDLASIGNFTGSGSTTVNLTALGMLSGTQQILIQNIGTGILSDFTLATTSLGGYSLSLADVNNNLVLNEALIPNSAYFNGAGSDLNTYANYNTTVSSGTPVAAIPVSTSNIFFSANGNTNKTPNLSANLAVNSVTFGTGSGTAGNGITISNTNGAKLTIEATNANGNTAGNGITVLSGGGNNTINAPVVLGASQTWTVTDAASTLTVGSAISDGNAGYALTKAGSGTLTLAAANTYSGGTSVTGGTLYGDGGSVGASTSTSAFGTGAVTVAAGAAAGGNGVYAPSAAGFALAGTGTTTLSASATLISGGAQPAIGGSTTQVNGSAAVVSAITTSTIPLPAGGVGGLVLDNRTAAGVILNAATLGASVPNANLTFYLGAGTVGADVTSAANLGMITKTNDTTGQSIFNFANPNIDSTYITVLGNTANELSFASGDTITAIDLTGKNLQFNLNTPYLLIHAGDNADYSGITTTGGSTGGVANNGYVTDLSLTIGASTAASEYYATQLYLFDGNLEIVPEPGTWALMLGGFVVLVVWERRKNRLG